MYNMHQHQGLATTVLGFLSKMLPEENRRINHKEKQTHTRLDWQTLRTQSLQPGGFGEERVLIWYVKITTLSTCNLSIVQA